MTEDYVNGLGSAKCSENSQLPLMMAGFFDTAWKLRFAGLNIYKLCAY
jgi:hypothetical protein